MQIHFALSEPPQWDGDERLGGTAIVHLTPGLDGVSRAVNEADRGLLPAEATVVAGQPLTMDPSRAPDGQGHPLDPAAGAAVARSRATPQASSTSATEPGLRACASATPTASRRGSRGTSRTSSRRSSTRVSLSPADLQEANVNLVNGDPYGGSLALDQNFLWRPLASQPGHRTPVDGVWHIGASTHPGPGLGGGSGALVAQQLLEPPFTKRMVSRLRGSG